MQCFLDKLLNINQCTMRVSLIGGKPMKQEDKGKEDGESSGNECKIVRYPV